jgi:predicted dehydrogenase
MDAPLRVGLVGAGPWAHIAHAPAIAAHPQTLFAGIWARRLEAASELAAKHDAPAFARLEALFEASDAVVFSVPPDVQETLAIRAAEAGKALLLEKPIAASLVGAERLSDAAADVPTLVALRWRYSDAVRAFIATAQTQQPFAGRGIFVSASFLPGNPFATPWRLDRGALLDLGPHVVDLLDAALGRVTGVRAHGHLRSWIGLLLEHESGAHSEVSLCANVPGEPSQAGVELFGPAGALRIDCTTATRPRDFVTMYDEFISAARGSAPATCDVRRGLELQRVLHEAEQQLLA